MGKEEVFDTKTVSGHRICFVASGMLLKQAVSTRACSLTPLGRGWRHASHPPSPGSPEWEGGAPVVPPVWEPVCVRHSGEHHGV